MYQYVEFDGVPLPVQDHQQDHDPTAAEPTIVDSIGGAFDWLGATRRVGRRQVIRMRGKFSGETHNLVDDASDPLVDDASENIITGTGAEYVRAEVMAVMEKIGVRGTLYRERLDDATRQWKTARLLSIPWRRSVDDMGMIAELECQFETLQAAWRDASSTNAGTTTLANVAGNVTVDNGGSLPVEDAVITVTRNSGTVTQVDIADASSGIAMRWTGSLGSGDVLTIDCGARTVKENTSNAYSGFSLLSTHTAQGWLPLRAGTTVLSVTTTGGACDIDVDFYEQYP